MNIWGERDGGDLKRANVAQDGWKVDQSRIRSGEDLPGAEMTLSYNRYDQLDVYLMHLAVETRLINCKKNLIINANLAHLIQLGNLKSISIISAVGHEHPCK